MSLKQEIDEIKVNHLDLENQSLKCNNITINTIFPGSVPLTQFYNQTLTGDYVAKGVGLFQNSSGKINVSGIPAGSIKEKIYLYWVVHRTLNDISINIGNLNGNQIHGQLIGSSDATVPFNFGVFDFFRLDVTGIANFGLNTLSGFPKSTNYYTNGASLVVIYSNPALPTKTIIINDGALSFYNPQTVTTIISNFTAQEPVTAFTSYIAGEGTPPFDQELFNSQIVGTNIFNCFEGLCWDTYTKNVSSLVNPGDTSAEVGISIQCDLLIWAAQVFSITFTAPSRGINIAKCVLI